MQGMPADFIKSMSFAIIELSIAVFIMSKAMRSLGELNKDQMDTALVGFSAIVGLITAFVAANEILGKTKVGESGPSWIALGVGLIMLSAAVDLMLPAIWALGSLKPDVLNQGLFGISAIIALFAALELVSMAVTKIGGFKSLLGLAAAATCFVELSLAIDALLPAILILGYMKPENLVQGVGALVVIMGMFTILAAVAGEASSITGVAAIIAITIALNKLSDVISKLATIESDKLIVVGGLLTALGAVFVVLAAITKAGKLGGSMFVMAESMLIFCTALVELAVAFKLIASIKLMDLVKGIIAIAAAIAIFVGAAAVIKYLGLGLTIAELSVSLLSMGAAVFLTATGLTLFCLALAMLPGAVTLFIEGIAGIFDAIGDLALALSDSIDELKDSITEIVKDLVELLLAGVIGALEGIDEQLADLINVVVDIVLKIL